MADEQKPKLDQRDRLDDPEKPELNRETVQDLTESEAEAAWGGFGCGCTETDRLYQR